MDAVTLAAANAAATKRFPQVLPPGLAQKLSKNGQRLTVAVLSDSTGVKQSTADPRWPYLLGQLISAAAPGCAVNYFAWSDPTAGGTVNAGSYDAGTVIAAGGSAPATISDGFHHANGAPATLDTGESWQSVSSAQISSNTFAVTTAGTAGQASVNTGCTEHTITASITYAPTGASSNLARVWVRGDAFGTTALLVEAVAGTSSGNLTLNIYRRLNSSSTVAATNATSTAIGGTTQTLTITTKGNTVTATMAGASVSYTLTPAEQSISAWMNGPVVTLYLGGAAGTVFNSFSLAPMVPRVDIWCGATSGMNAEYSQARIAQQIPVTPDLVLISYGHNHVSGTDERPYLESLVRTVRDFHPAAQIVLGTQNPRNPAVWGSTIQRADLHRQTSVVTFGQQEGLPVVDIAKVWLANPSYATNWLNSDGLHPNSAGSQVWAQEWFNRLLTTAAVDQRPLPRQSRLLVQAAQLAALEGAPTQAVVNSLVTSWALTHGATNSVSCLVDVPASWLAVNIWLLFTYPSQSGLTGSTNGVAWEVATAGLSDPTLTLQGDPAAAVSSAPWLTSPAFTTVASRNSGLNNNIAYPTVPILVNSTTPVYLPAQRPLALRIRRLGASGSDTFASAVNLLGAVIERAG